ncbi:TMM68 protein, partial [Oxylabes madagascariensis]|nr:TMM68 protein [Oxylabes madagascariensis]
YQRNNELKADPLSDVWNSVRKTIASFWDIYARIWHGYELHGVENLPEGPGILVYYHGAIPIDYLYFLSRLFLWKKRLCLSVADHFVFRLPGLKLLLAVTGVIPGTREECLVALKNGYLVSISPGGVREALFSDESYQLMWGNRKGFAQVALEAKVPIIPMYTQNVREGYRMFKERRFFRQLYENTRLPFTPPYGGLPVKFRTYIGKPIPYDPNITTEELVEKVRKSKFLFSFQTKTAVQALISKHQTIPGNIWKALLERFDKRRK